MPHGVRSGMATSVQLKPPENFNFSKPDNWGKWKKRFEQFRVAAGLQEENEPRQVSTLLYCMGEEAESVLSSTDITDEDRKKYDAVMAKFDAFFQVRRNIIFERAKFNRRVQNEGESVEQFITALYTLVETCDYGTLKEQMIRDRIVVGILNTGLSERMQSEANLTLEKAKTMARQKEAIAEQNSQLRGDGSKQAPILLGQVRGNPSSRPTSRRRDIAVRSDKRSSVTDATRVSLGKPQCTRCGRSKHQTGDRCPAKEATCHKCNRIGHYQSQCFSKTVAATTNELSLDTAFVGTVSSKQQLSWTTTLLVKGKEVTFKIDTGAEVTAISEDTFRQLRGVRLQIPSKVLYGLARHTLDVRGQFMTTLRHEQSSSLQPVFVVQGLKNNLLGLPAVVSLQLIHRVNNIRTGDDIRKMFPKVFSGLGTMGEPYQIKLKEGALPHSIYAPRTVAIPLRSKVKDELRRMEEMGVISKIRDPTPWCAAMVVVPKRSGAVRICVDLKPLNQSVLREVHPIPKVDETLAQLSGATMFSKLDANSGFWQIPLAPESRPLTTFLTPFGRFCFNKLPFGVSSAPELFQRRMSQILEGLDGVLCQMDDVLIFGSDKAQHDQRLTAALKRLQAAGVTLNSEKCEFAKTRVKFLGHVIDLEGIRPDSDKISAIIQMTAPCNVSEVRRFLGMVNQLGKFSPRVSELTQPLRELLSSKRSWTWGSSQEEAFSQIKAELTKPTVLTLYDPQAPTKVSADASSYGVGAVLLQQAGDIWKPVAYASRSMTETERRYAQIEKEALAVVWACDKFSDYVLGRSFQIETDHKPLVPLLSTKQLDCLPPRVLRFRLRLARYTYTIEHVPGKLLYTADALSRAPQTSTVETLEFEEEVEAFIEGVSDNLPVSKSGLETYQRAQSSDSICSKVKGYCTSGWPKKHLIEAELLPYWKTRNSLTLHNGLLLYNSRIVVPHSLQQETLEKIHEGHQGIERCRTLINSSVWWPGVSQSIAEKIHKCTTCAKESVPNKEPLLTNPLPDYPWQMVGSDLFEMSGEHYLLVVDYFSRFPEIAKLTSTTSAAVITSLKSIFARHGIPEVLRSDNGPQYASQQFSTFAESRKWGGGVFPA